VGSQVVDQFDSSPINLARITRDLIMAARGSSSRHVCSVDKSGAIVSVRGSVVDVRFDEHLPPIYSVLRAGDEGQIVIEVLAQRMRVTCAGLR
jgi:hypothetical protein